MTKVEVGLQGYSAKFGPRVGGEPLESGPMGPSVKIQVVLHMLGAPHLPH